MKYAINKDEKFIQMRVQEEKLDATVSPELKTTFITLNAEGMRNLILDMEEVKYVDSSGLSALLIANRLCTEQKGTMVMVNVTEHVLKLIKISQLEKVLNLLPTVEEARDLVFMNELESNLRSEQEASE